MRRRSWAETIRRKARGSVKRDLVGAVPSTKSRRLKPALHGAFALCSVHENCIQDETSMTWRGCCGDICNVRRECDARGEREPRYAARRACYSGVGGNRSEDLRPRFARLHAGTAVRGWVSV